MKNAFRRGDEMTVNALLNEVFAFKRDKKSMRNAIPWQWALWGCLLCFCFGYLLPGDSGWMIVAALAVAVIVFLARTSETVEPQVLLLTHEPTDESKRSAHASSRRSYRRRYPNSKKHRESSDQ